MTISPRKSSIESFIFTYSLMHYFSVFQGYVSVELTPVAAVSVQLFSGDTELHVNGPIWISLSIPDTRGLQNSSVVPAWFFNWTTGE